MSRSKVKAGEAFVELGIKNMLQKGLNAAAADLKKYGRGVAAIGATMSGLSAAALAPLTAAVMKFGAAGDVLDKMSKRTGVGVEALSELAFAAEQSGSDIESVERGIKGMQRALLNASMGSTEVIDSLDMLGVSMEQLQGLNPEDQFTLLADAVAGIEDPSTRAALSMKIFGRAGADLLPLMNEGANGVANLREEARDLGRQMSEEDATAAAEYTDAMNRMKSVLGGVANRIGAALAPVITDIANRMANSMKVISGFIDRNRGIVVAAGATAVALGVAGAAVTTLGLTMMGAAGVLSGAATVISGAGAVIAAVFSPIGAVILGVSIAVGALAAGVAVAGVMFFQAAKETGLLSDAWDHLKRIAETLLTTVRTTITGISDAMAGGDWKLAAQIGWAGVKVAFFEGIQSISIAWASMMPKLWETLKSFLKKAAEATKGTVAFIAKSMVSPLQGATHFAQFMASDIFNFSGASGGVGEWIKTQKEEAKDELEELVALAKEKRKALDDAMAGTTEGAVAAVAGKTAGTTTATTGAVEADIDAAMAPLEQAQAELNKALKRVSELQSKGVVADDEAAKVEDRARKQFSEQMRRLRAGPEEFDMRADEIVSTADQSGSTRSGPSGSFSAFAASVIGMNTPNFEREQLKVSNQIAKNTKETAKRVGAPQTARFS